MNKIFITIVFLAFVFSANAQSDSPAKNAGTSFLKIHLNNSNRWLKAGTARTLPFSDGTNISYRAIQAADIPDLSTTYLRQGTNALTQNTSINNTFDFRFGNTTKLDSFEVFANRINFGLNGFSFLKTNGTGGGDVNENLFFGYKAGNAFTGLGGRYANTIIGKGAGLVFRDTSAAGFSSSNVIVGYNAASTLTYGSFNTIVGTAAGGITTQNQVTAFGYHAGAGGSSSQSVLVGAFAGLNGGGTYTAVGWEACQGCGSATTAVGLTAGRNTSGSGLNSFFGSGAGTGATGSTAYAVDAFGVSSFGAITTGNNNVGFGRNTGQSCTTCTGNIFIGSNSGASTTTGANNIVIGGVASSATASDEINIGSTFFATGRTNSSTRKIGINIAAPVTMLDIANTITSNNAVSYPLRVRGTTTVGAVQPGFGTGIEFTIPNRTGVATLAGNMAVVSTDTTNASIDAALIFSNIVNGTLAERMRLTGSVLSLGGNTVLTQGTNTLAQALKFNGSFAARFGETTALTDFTTRVSDSLTLTGATNIYTSSGTTQLSSGGAMTIFSSDNITQAAINDLSVSATNIVTTATGTTTTNVVDNNANAYTLKINSGETFLKVNSTNGSPVLTVGSTETGATTNFVANPTGTISSSVWTPTLTLTNVTVVDTGEFHYMRIGNMITVTGYLEVDPDAAESAVQIDVSPPVLSGLSATAGNFNVQMTPAAAPGDMPLAEGFLTGGNIVFTLWNAGDGTNRRVHITGTIRYE